MLDLGSGASITSALLARAYGFIVYTTDLWSAPGENMRFFESLGLTNRNVIPLRIDASEGLPFAECFFDAVVSIDSYIAPVRSFPLWLKPLRERDCGFSVFRQRT